MGINMDNQASIKKTQRPLSAAWKNFWYVFAEPWNLLLILGVFVLFAVTLTPKLPAATSALAQILLTLSSAVLGGRIASRLEVLAEGNVLLARGRVAVRSLKLLLRNTAALESRVTTFLRNSAEIRQNPEVTVRNYEEIIGTCRLLQEETVSSIENWTDIVQEADISTVVGQISELKAAIDERQQQMDELELQSRQAKAANETEKAAMQQELSRRAMELDHLKVELSRAKTKLASNDQLSMHTRSSIMDGLVGATIPRMVTGTFAQGPISGSGRKNEG
jgi:hypothetical protein